MRNLTKDEIEEAYEKNTGVLIAMNLRQGRKIPSPYRSTVQKPRCIYMGKDAHEAVHNAVVAEEVAKMAARCEMIQSERKTSSPGASGQALLQKTRSKCLLRTEQ